MCCRCVQAKPLEEIIKWWGEKIKVLINISEFRISYNVSPGQKLPVVFTQNGVISLSLMKWGLPAVFNVKEKDHDVVSYNARIETILQKRTFSQLMRSQRCAVLCNGYYEWKKENGKSVPFLIHSPGMQIMPLGGLWTEESPGGALCFTVITKNPRRNLADIHDRMPFVVAQDKVDKWIDGRYFPVNPEDEFADHKGPLEFHHVSMNVNSSRYDAPDCIEKIEVPEQGELF
ncbi:MAG TPA: hypothetical protein DCZ94_17825 [Lentisphaeria bacterium]|nr:MAG: hypothetical protein A2X48_03625 [Lentisphaerae bacterium GWF2_49_21]HBC88805.1 hypothetical protein [Lentisphaeria bacterium]